MALPTIAAPRPMATPSQRCCCFEPAQDEVDASDRLAAATTVMIKPVLIFIFDLLCSGLKQ
jgi:hypothetical protein